MNEIEARNNAVSTAATVRGDDAPVVSSNDDRNGGSSAPDQLTGAGVADSSAASDQPIPGRDTQHRRSPARPTVFANGHFRDAPANTNQNGTAHVSSVTEHAAAAAAAKLEPGSASPAASQRAATVPDSPPVEQALADFAPGDQGASGGGFEAARQRLYSTDGVPDSLRAAADELRGAHPGVPFLDHAWGQARSRGEPVIDTHAPSIASVARWLSGNLSTDLAADAYSRPLHMALRVRLYTRADVLYLGCVMIA